MVQRYIYAGGYPKAIESRYQSDPRLAAALAGVQAGSSMAPVQSPLEGLARALQGMVGGYQQRQVTKDYDRQADEYRTQIAKALSAPPDRRQVMLSQLDPDAALAAAFTDQPQDERWEDLTDEQEAQLGLDTSGAWQRSSSNKLQEVSAPRKPEGPPELVQVVENGRMVWKPKAEAVGQQSALPPQGPAPTNASVINLQMPDGTIRGFNARDTAGIDAALAAGAVEQTSGGMSVTVGADGQPIITFGGPAKPATDTQAITAGYQQRMINAEKTIQDLADKGYTKPSLVQQGMAAIPGVGNFLTSDEQQVLDQAQRDFINAVLRRESGAVISPSEFENARAQYFPQPGDGPEVLAKKRQNREQAIANFGVAAGPARVPGPSAPEGGEVRWKIVDGVLVKDTGQ